MSRFVFLQFGPFVFTSTSSKASQFSTSPKECENSLLEALSDCKDVWLKYKEKVRRN